MTKLQGDDASAAADAIWLRRLEAAARSAADDHLRAGDQVRRQLGLALAELAAAFGARATSVDGEHAILDTVDERAERIGRNEALFREVNERLKEIGVGFSFVTETAVFVCECGDASCSDSIEMSLAEYERIRSDPTLFAVVLGHDAPDVETVVETHDGWGIVKKHPGEPAQLAKSEDPRS